MPDKLAELNSAFSGGFRESPLGDNDPRTSGLWAQPGGSSGRKLPRPDTRFGSLTRSFVWRYGISLVFVATALIFTLLLQRLFPQPFFPLFFAAVMASAWFGGPTAGLLSVLA